MCFFFPKSHKVCKESRIVLFGCSESILIIKFLYNSGSDGSPSYLSSDINNNLSVRQILKESVRYLFFVK
jgi:hypothetical protein